MTRLPAIALRGFAVLALGLTLAVGHVAFAAAGAAPGAEACRAGSADACPAVAASGRTASGKPVARTARADD